MGRGQRVPGRDIGSTHSYVGRSVSENLGITVECTSDEISVLSPLGQSVRVNRIFRNVLLEVQWVVFLANLIELPFEDRLDSGYGLDRRVPVVEKLVWKECETYLAYVSVSISGDSFVRDIRTVREFLDVFPDELSGLPLNREVEFSIELLSGIVSVSIAHYRMTLKELTELKA
ncbi:uncharacterized protein [Gossypium hirsutum]|uniref:Uncharacterized protein n=1 Tax=Gossypium hirsutum TaxID=3635 RepID=A0ABM3AZH0_GOSHI|nr:uncharacterized protein LOC121223161 [Gossypium hirsutum]